MKALVAQADSVESEGPAVQHEMSYALRTVLRRVAADQPIDVPPEVMREARALLRDRRDHPMTIEAASVWLAQLAAGVNDAHDPEAVLGRACTLVLACQESMADDPNEDLVLDGHIFSDDNTIVALRTFDRWPSVATLHRFLVQQAKARQQMWSDLEWLVVRVDFPDTPIAAVPAVALAPPITAPPAVRQSSRRRAVAS